jgi:NAD(P)-dependent dehydrogenase (short-subunit alcohol dehydrogenase family)
MSERPLQGRTALVAGAGPNIGAGIALALAEAGAFVWPLDRDRAAAESCTRAIVEAGGEAAPLVADVADPEAVEAAVASASERGPVDVLVNGTAVYNEQGVLEMSPADWARQLEVTLTGAFLLTKAVTSRLVAAERPGAVINLGSTAGHQGQPGNIAYCSAKGGLLNFTRSAAMELAPHGIRVNSLTPTATGLEELEQRAADWGVPEPSEASRERKRRSRSLIPLGRLPLPSDYGRAAVFLASEAANSITGIDLPVDGGALARYWAWHPGSHE